MSSLQNPAAYLAAQCQHPSPEPCRTSTVQLLLLVLHYEVLLLLLLHGF
jgi:hypothetical protein